MKRLYIKNQSAIVRWLGLVLVIVIFGFWSDWNLFSEYNLKSMLETLTPLMITCLGMTFIFAHGGMDISSGAVVALGSLGAVVMMNATESLLLGTAAAMTLAVFCYIINVFVTNKWGLMATITSLAIMFSARGLVTYLCQKTTNESISIATVDVTLFKKDHLFMIGIMALAIVVLGILFNYTKIGKGAKAIGDNVCSARQNGVRVDFVKLICYIIAGICVGFASMFKVCGTGMVQSTTGNGLEMDVLVAVVLGGMTLSGGNHTKLSAAVVGALTYVILVKGLTIVGINPNVVGLVKAIIFLAIIYMTAQRNKLTVLPR